MLSHRLLLAAALLGAAGAPASAGRTVVVCDDVQAPASLDPYSVFSEKVHTLLQQVLEGLVRFAPDGSLEPALAERWEQKDPLTMRFHLRRGVRFHDGSPFEAGSVKFSLEKYVAPETRYPGFPFVSTLAGVEVVDAHTVDVKTTVPDGLLLNRLAAWVHIVPKDYYLEKGSAAFSQAPVGTGPFRFEGWKADRIRLAKSGDYWQAGRPKIGVLEFRFVPWEKQVSELLAGRIDVLTELPGTMTLEVSRTTTTQVIKRETFYAMVGPLNVTSGPLKDRRLRQALNHAVDNEELIRYDVLGNGRAIATLSLPGEEGHNPELVPYRHDPARARQLLKEAGYPKGLTLQALVKEQGVRTFRIIEKQLERVGIKVKAQITPDSDIVKDIPTREWDLLYGGCPDPMNHMYFISSIVLFSKSPYSIVKDETFDRMLMEMAGTLDPKEREAKARAVDKRVYDEALSLFTYQRFKTYGVKRGLRFAPPVTGMPFFFDLEAPDDVPALGTKES